MHTCNPSAGKVGTGRPWELMASQLSLPGELQVQRETLAQTHKVAGNMRNDTQG